MSISQSELNKSIYKDDIAYFVSGSDLTAYFPNCKIVKAADLDNYKSIYELLPNSLDFVFILVETTGINNGHWQLLYRDNKTFHFFDSYGDQPTTILNFVPKYLNKLLGNNYKADMGHILKSINKADKLLINRHPFQTNGDDINTCGRWCILRLSLALRENKSDQDFIKFIKQKNKETRYKYDELVCGYITINK